MHIKNSKETVNQRLLLKKAHRTHRVSQNVWLKSYINLNAELQRKKAKQDFENDFVKLMSHTVFSKIM